MILAGVDPGYTTGWCVMDDTDVLDIGEAPLEGLAAPLWAAIEKYDPDVVLIESVVSTGRLNRDKVHQAMAAGIAMGMAQVLGSSVKWINPVHTKWARGRSPVETKSPHMRDAVALIEVHRMGIVGDGET